MFVRGSHHHVRETPDAKHARTPDPVSMPVTELDHNPQTVVPHKDSAATAIRTSALTKRYGSTLALDALDLSVREGDVYGYLGPNGSGKTTTIRLLLGLHRPSSGHAEVFGHDAWRDPVTAHRRVAYVAGEPAGTPTCQHRRTPPKTSPSR